MIFSAELFFMQTEFFIVFSEIIGKRHMNIHIVMGGVSKLLQGIGNSLLAYGAYE